jgi:beta-N-acetylhexosaminidase
MTDDLSMKALKGSFSERTKMALQAGCDIILHCNGNLNEMQAINQELPIIDDSLKIKLLD